MVFIKTHKNIGFEFRLFIQKTYTFFYISFWKNLPEKIIKTSEALSYESNSYNYLSFHIDSTISKQKRFSVSCGLMLLNKILFYIKGE